MPNLHGAYAVLSPPPKPYAEDPAVLSFYRDLLEPFGREVDPELLRAGPHVDHGASRPDRRTRSSTSA